MSKWVKIGAALVALASGCLFPVRNDGFRERLAAGCRNSKECRALEQESYERQRDCQHYRDCDEVSKDIGVVGKLAREVAEAERDAYQKAYQERTDAAYAKREAEAAAAQAAYEEQLRKEDEQRKAEAAKAAREAEAAFARRSELRELGRSSAAHAVPLLTLAICSIREEIASLKAEFREMKVLDRRSGTANLYERREMTRAIIEREDAEKALAARIRSEYQSRPESCQSKRQKALVACIKDRSACTNELSTLADIHEAFHGEAPGPI